MIFLTLLVVQGIETISYLSTGSELVLNGHSGIQISNGEISCFLGIFNSTYPYGIKCADTFPLYFDETRRTHFGAEVLTEANLNFLGGLTVGAQDQWSLVHSDLFSETEAETWSNKSITECAGVRMLGGYCQYSSGNSSTVLTLPVHTQVTLKLSWHFIDQWRGETAYIVLGTTSSSQAVWSYTYDIAQSVTPIDVCGNSEYGEGKFSMPVQVTIQHSDEQLLVLLGSTLEPQPCLKSWGVSGLEVYIR